MGENLLPETAADLGSANNILPFSQRSSQRRPSPATVLDYLYGVIDGTRLGLSEEDLERLFTFASNSPAARALRCRRRMIARAIDDTCLRIGPDARILCIGGDHFREAELSQAIRHHAFNELLVFEPNRACQAVVAEEYGPWGVQTCSGSLEQLLGGQLHFARYDLVYSAGLCDHLDDPACLLLATLLFKALKPGGRLLLGSMRKGIANLDHLESLLNWRPRCRRDDQLLDLLQGIDYNQIANARVVHDIGHRIAFLEALRYG